MKLSERFAKIASLAPEAVAVDGGDLVSWKMLTDQAAAIADALNQANIPADAAIGVLARNNARVVAALLALLTGERFIAPISPHQPVGALIRELGDLRFAAVIGLADDIGPEVSAAIEAANGIIIRIGDDGAVATPKQFAGHDDYRRRPGEAVLERISSGTTGAPKRVPVTADALESGILAGAPSYAAAQAARAGGLERVADCAILFNPIAHASGLFRMVNSLYFGRTTVLHERFDVATWADAVRRYRPQSASLVPAMIQMVIDANVPADALSSLAAVRSGTAPLDPALQTVFEERYGVPILIDYGASEFIGGVCGWTLRDHRRYGSAKRGSVGRAKDGVTVRVLDPVSGAPLPPGKVGAIEVGSDRFAASPCVTTDLGALDEDGFLFIHGRADEAIMRGGMKILPEKVAEILRLHDGVRDAAVLGVKDQRLGAVPLAVIEAAEGGAPDAGALDMLVRQHLPAYWAPTAYEFVDALPRTISYKVARAELRTLLDKKFDFA